MLVFRGDLISRRFDVGGQVSVVPSLVFVEGENRILFGEQVRAKVIGLIHGSRVLEHLTFIER